MKDRIVKIVSGAGGAEAASVRVAVPERDSFGHYSTNVAMRIAKERGRKPLDLATDLAKKIAASAPRGFFEKVEAAPPGFINFWLTKETVQAEFARIAGDRHFGGSKAGGKRTVIVEYSQPNIAKKMHVGHLRSTIIGDALANILEFLGYRAIRWNYLGDWGTQFGKLIAAYNLWGDKAAVERDPVAELQKLYVRFHDEAKSKPDLEDRGRDEFRKLEEGDRGSRKLWKWFRDESLEEFKKMYALLGVGFDVWIGESFFKDDAKKLAGELLQKKIAERSEGAVIVKLDAFNMPPALIEKADGASLYLSRDLANIRYRLKKYKPAKILYVVGNEQSLHFEQLFALAKPLGLGAAELLHIKFGLVLAGTGKKLSTREGRSEPLEHLIREAIERSRAVVAEKNKALSDEEREEVARAVAIGALKYNDLKENRTTDIVFDWERMLDFAGDSGPYLQYTYARLRSILRKAGKSGKSGKSDPAFLAGHAELALMRKLFEFPDAVLAAGELYSTSVLAAYLYKLAVAANQFYEMTPVLKDENAPRGAARLLLIDVASRVLRKGLGLLGISTPEKI